MCALVTGVQTCALPISDSVTLTLIRNDLSFASAGVTRNQRAAGAAVDHAFAPDSAVYANLVGASVAQAQAAFDQLSGEIHASAVAAAVTDAGLVRQTLLDRNRTGGSADGERFSLWGQWLGSWGDTDASSNAARPDRADRKGT